MAVTLGTTTGDNVTLNTVGASIGLSSSASLITGWFFPTTLTAGRFVWGQSVAAGTRLAISGTTELAFNTARATTNDVFTSTDAALVTNTWYFHAILWTVDGTGAAAATMWLGSPSLSGGLRKVTWTRSGGSGAGSGSTRISIGNDNGTIATAFQGDLCEFNYFQENSVSNGNLFGISTLGTIDATAEDVTLRTIVDPLFRGDYGALERVGTHAMLEDSSSTGWLASLPLVGVSPAYFQNWGARGAGAALATSSGTVVASTNQPRPSMLIPGFGVVPSQRGRRIGRVRAGMGARGR